MDTQQPTCLVSACLVGLCTRYDGRPKENPSCITRLKNFTWIPVCPEQLGGLPTPRDAADITGGDGQDVLDGKARVLTKNGTDLSAEFIRGAKQVLHIAQSQNIQTAYLKARSPSCAVNGKIGVTAALLKSCNIHIVDF